MNNAMIEMGTKRAPININKLTIDKFIPPTLLVYCNRNFIFLVRFV